MEASQADDNCSTKEKKLEEQTQVYRHFSYDSINDVIYLNFTNDL